MSLPIISRDLWFNFAEEWKSCLKGPCYPKIISSTWTLLCGSKGTRILSRHFHLILVFSCTLYQKLIERNKFFFFLQQALQFAAFCRKKTQTAWQLHKQVSMTGAGIFKTSRAVDGCFYEFQELAEGGLRISEVSEGRDVWWKSWWYCHLMFLMKEYFGVKLIAKRKTAAYLSEEVSQLSGVKNHWW